MIKIVQTDTVEVPAITIDTAVGGSDESSITVDFDTSLGRPVVVANIDQAERTVLYPATPTPYTTTGADDATIGTIAWSLATPDLLDAQDGSGGLAVMVGAEDSKDTSVRIVKPGAVIGTENKATNTIVDPSMTGITYGSSSDLWGESWTYSDVNDSDFGVVVSYTGITSGSVTHYLRISGLGLAVPATATISGITAEIYPQYLGGTILVDMIRVTVYYIDSLTTDTVPLAWEGIELDQADTAAGYITHYREVARTINLNVGSFTLKANATFGISSEGAITVGPWQVRYYILRETAV
jgi:hypothetical protein